MGGTGPLSHPLATDSKAPLHENTRRSRRLRHQPRDRDSPTGRRQPVPPSQLSPNIDTTAASTRHQAPNPEPRTQPSIPHHHPKPPPPPVPTPPATMEQQIPLNHEASAGSTNMQITHELPAEVVQCLENARFLHLATCTDNIPHVSLMNYTYLPSTPYSSAPVIVMTTNPASKKMNNLVANPSVSLLVHDCTSPHPPIPHPPTPPQTNNPPPPPSQGSPTAQQPAPPPAASRPGPPPPLPQTRPSPPSSSTSTHPPSRPSAPPSTARRASSPPARTRSASTAPSTSRPTRLTPAPTSCGGRASSAVAVAAVRRTAGAAASWPARRCG